ncbi:hypothetical protein AB0A77_34615 [Streptomyces varsoviensis]|uniref:hypothetical protein n=1 Tax=Streptomyces varsoviensis TaxID=67373 RepID=UPI0033CB1FCF
MLAGPLPRPPVVIALALCSCAGTSPADGKNHSTPPGKASTEQCTAGGTASGSATGGSIPVGPGPQPHYTVQQQPAPGSCHYRDDQGQPLQDAACTPGALNPKVTQAALNSTICSPSGHTKGTRPPTAVTAPEKSANAKSYGYTGSLHDAEYDHLVSLELDGDPNDPRNLWAGAGTPSSEHDSHSLTWVAVEAR